MAKVSKQQDLLKRIISAKPRVLIMGVAGFIFSYAFLSRAFDTGSYWQYLGALLFAVLGIKLVLRSYKKSK